MTVSHLGGCSVGHSTARIVSAAGNVERHLLLAAGRVEDEIAPGRSWRDVFALVFDLAAVGTYSHDRSILQQLSKQKYDRETCLI